MRTLVLTLAQLAGAALLLAGLYLLAGLAWTLVVGGVALLVVSTLAEIIDGPSLRQRRITRALRKG
jgi:hypothetical protein